MGDNMGIRNTRNRRNRCCECSSPPPVYEFPSPPPVVGECSVCSTAENAGRNLWDWLPSAKSTLLGPSLWDILLHLLNLLPMSVVAWLGIAHKKTSSDDCDESGKEPKGKHQKVCLPDISPCPVCPCNISYREGRDELATWMSNEYMKLAEELADLKRLTDEGQGSEDKRFLQEARHYVLDRLAEMLTKREELEKRMKRQEKGDNR